MTRYRTIVADPPWHVATGPAGSAVGEGWVVHDGRSRALAYPTMSVAEIKSLPVADPHSFVMAYSPYRAQPESATRRG